MRICSGLCHGGSKGRNSVYSELIRSAILPSGWIQLGDIYNWAIPGSFIAKEIKKKVLQQMNSSLSNALHMVGQALLVPCLVVLMAFMAISVWELGSIIVEYFMERRKMKSNIPTLIKSIAVSDRKDIGKLVDESLLLRRQKSPSHPTRGGKHVKSIVNRFSTAAFGKRGGLL